MKNIAILMLLITTFISCGQQEQAPTIVGVENTYTLEVPNNLAAMQELYPDADLQYGNTFLQRYLVSLQGEKTISFDHFVREELLSYSKRENYMVLDEKKEVINDLPTLIYEVEMSQGEDMMYMMQALYNGKKGNYEVIQWCKRADMEAQRENMLKIVHTFKEV